MIDIIHDLSEITTIPEQTLSKFFKKMSLCITESFLEENKKDPDEICSLDIGIGILQIKKINAELKFKFIPSDYLSLCFKKLAIPGTLSPLNQEINDALAKRFADVYKDLF